MKPLGLRAVLRWPHVSELETGPEEGSLLPSGDTALRARTGAPGCRTSRLLRAVIHPKTAACKDTGMWDGGQGERPRSPCPGPRGVASGSDGVEMQMQMGT